MSRSLSRLMRLTEECIPATTLESLTVELDEVCMKWKQIDDSLLSQQTASSRWKTLLVPQIVPNGEQLKYQNDVQLLFSSFQQCLQSRDYCHPRTTHLKKYKDTARDVNMDLHTLPELERATVSVYNNDLPNLDYIDEDFAVCTFQIINPRTGQTHQRIEVRENQSLMDLYKAIYCLHDAIAHQEDTHAIADDQSGESSITDSSFFRIDEIDYFNNNDDSITFEFLQKNESSSACIITESSPRIVSSQSRQRTRLQDSKDRAKLLLQRKQQTLSNVSEKPVSGGSLHNVRSISWRFSTIQQFQLDIGCLLQYSHHRGCCVHLIQYVDRRIIKETPSSFPREIMRAKFRRRRCQVCDLANAQYIVMDDRLSDTNPLFMCKLCYEMMHYDSDGNLLYSDFSVFPYIHDN